MTTIAIDRPYPGPVPQLLEWFRRRQRRRAQPDIIKLLDELNERLLAELENEPDLRPWARAHRPAHTWGDRAPQGEPAL